MQLTWHAPAWSGEVERMGPAYYIEADMTPIAVRIHAETAPSLEDAQFEIFDDEVTIFSDRRSSYHSDTTGRDVYIGPSTTIPLVMGDTDEVNAEDFTEDLIIEEGSWVTCKLVKDGKGKNFTVHLVLEEE